MVSLARVILTYCYCNRWRAFDGNMTDDQRDYPFTRTAHDIYELTPMAHVCPTLFARLNCCRS